jgi:hypothetical protein
MTSGLNYPTNPQPFSVTCRSCGIDIDVVGSIRRNLLKGNQNLLSTCVTWKDGELVSYQPIICQGCGQRQEKD